MSRVTRALTAAAVAMLVLSGCGIQSMEVPVDAGPAPSKATCRPPAAETGGSKVYLVCGSHVDAVERGVPLAHSTERVAVAGALLAELQVSPPPNEVEAGFSSAVPPDLRVAGPAAEDPDELLRLSQHPDDLPAFALVQLICTFSESALGDGNSSVLLGGPFEPDEGEPHRYHCAETLLHRPDAARNAGRPL